MEEDMPLPDQCEHLMNIVVESRKRFGKMCTDYEQKTSLVENKILNLQIETIANYRFKSKNVVPNINVEEMTNDLDDFKNDIVDSQKRMENLKRNVKNMQHIVLQLKGDNFGRMFRTPLTVEAMLAGAKSKNEKI